MNGDRSYGGIDVFRVAAAFLVVAIHTSPLGTYSETGDFILTGIIARVAVPFFFLTSGFFLITRYARDAERLKAFLRKTALLYLLCIVIYLPLNLYNNYFAMEPLLPNIIKDLVFDGTMYHLWYLPASMLGGALAWAVVRKAGFRTALVVTGALYVVGLFGNSYYGAAERLPFAAAFYGHLFEVSDYTRNGLFYAPVFFVMGGKIAETAQKQEDDSLTKLLIGFGVSFLLMIGEGMLLHTFQWQRHDSMYFALLPCMYFLSRLLICRRGHRHKTLRMTALAVYVIHPWVIVGVRMLAKITGTQETLTENSVIHYLAVSLISAACSVLFAVLCQRWQGKGQVLPHSANERSWVEINLGNLGHNIRVLQGAMDPECQMMAVVKANAYGHGAFEVAVHANQMGVKAFAVATIDEAIELRKYGIRGEILILGYTNPERAGELSRYRLSQTLIDYDYALQLNQQGHAIRTHIKVDTGMHRLGFGWEDTKKAAAVFVMKHIKVCGIYTHLCVSDSLADEDVSFTKKQVERFYHLLRELRKARITIPKIHMQSSYGFLNYPELKCDYVRIGIALYGVLSSPGDRTKLNLDLRPVLSLKARIVLIRILKAGESVGYGRSFTADRDLVIAMLPIGYGDGFPRNLSCGRSYVLINGRRAPIIGRICMDQLVVDITDIPYVRTGDVATLIGRDGEGEIAATITADQSESITNELLSRRGQRLPVAAISQN